MREVTLLKASDLRPTNWRNLPVNGIAAELLKVSSFWKVPGEQMVMREWVMMVPQKHKHLLSDVVVAKIQQAMNDEQQKINNQHCIKVTVELCD